VVLGIRPEDLTLEPTGPGGTLRGRVEVREPLGNEVLMHWQSPVGELISRVAGQQAPQVGETLDLHFAFAKVHFFDPASERALNGAVAAVS
jgi:multiple sugar transport system ATP-binding protein